MTNHTHNCHGCGTELTSEEIERVHESGITPHCTECVEQFFQKHFELLNEIIKDFADD